MSLLIFINAQSVPEGADRWVSLEVVSKPFSLVCIEGIVGEYGLYNKVVREEAGKPTKK